MSIPPSVMRVGIAAPGRRIGLWVPLFLLWPVLAAVAIALAPFVAVLAIFLWPRGWGKPLLLAGPRAISLLVALRGLEVDVVQPNDRVHIYFT